MRLIRPLSMFVISLLLCFVQSSVLAQRDLKDIPDPDADLQLAEFDVDPEFEISLFAADPRIAKPIQINFDPAGRMWVASSEVYPQIKPGQKATDKILILEDQDHDGVADTTTVFADGLLIPTGVAPGDGGAYVANSTELLHLSDTDGDGVADQERVVLSGFGTEDTHHILHTLRWGPEGLLYMNQSIYIHSHIETPHGVRRMNGGGIWHFRPETMELETYALGLVNTWGHAIDDYGQSMATDGAGGDGINYVFPGFVGVTSPGAKRIMPGLNPGKPKLCGLEIVGGAHLPDSWQGNLITNDFRAHRVCRYEIQENGAGYSTRELGELVKTRHQAFRPIDVKLGPDGAIYIADWYNPIIQHGEVDFRDPRRDHTHGRIWRVAAKGRPPLPYVNLYDEPTIRLLALLENAEPYQRTQVKRVLKERGKDEVLPELEQWQGRIQDQKLDDRVRLEALWVYQSLNVVNRDLVMSLLDSPDGRVRAAAIRVLYHWQDRMPNAFRALATAATDEHPRVRMEAIHALRRRHNAKSTEAAMAAVDFPIDQFLDYSLEQTGDETKDVWLTALREGEIDFSGKPNRLLFALQAADTADAVPFLLDAPELWSGDPQATRDAMTMVASRGNATELGNVLDLAVAETSSHSLRAALLRALLDAGQRRKVVPSGDLQPVVALLAVDSADVQTIAAELMGVWQLSEQRDALVSLAKDIDRPALQSAAIRGLVAMRAEAELLQLAADDQKTKTRIAAVSGLASINTERAAKHAASLLAHTIASDQPQELVLAILSQQNGDQLLSQAMADDGGNVRPDVAKVCIRAARTSGRDVAKLVDALAKAGGLADIAATLTQNQQQAILADVATTGDASRGEAIYRRSELNCQKCHAIGGAGGKVGPDLASIGASAPADYVLDSLVDPSAKIKENYHSLVVVNEDAKIFTGVKVRETDEALILRDAEDQEIAIPLDSIIDQKDGGSLMPAGLLNDLTRQEMVDLTRFLTELGKIGEYALPREPYVRTWRTLSAKVNQRMLDRVGEPQVPASDRFQWEPVFSTVAGHLAVAELPRHQPPFADAEVSYAQFEINLDQPSEQELRLSRIDGIRVYLDDIKLVAKETMKLDLSPGTHKVTLAIDHLDGSIVNVRVMLGQ